MIMLNLLTEIDAVVETIGTFLADAGTGSHI